MKSRIAVAGFESVGTLLPSCGMSASGANRKHRNSRCTFATACWKYSIQHGIAIGLWVVATCCGLSLPPSAAAQTFSSGTGFFIAPDGYVATCYHVVSNSSEVKIRDFTGRTYVGSVSFTDIANDLAVIKVDIASHSVLPIRRSTEVRKGDAVFTVGYPNIDMQGTDAKVTEGIVSSIAGIHGEPNSFQISAAVQPGNSGGPLIDSSGAVIGIVSAKLAQLNALKTSGALPENVNYAIKSNYLLELVATAPGLGGKLLGTSQKAAPEKLSSLVARVERATVLVIAKEGSVRAPPAAPPVTARPKDPYDGRLARGSVCTTSGECTGDNFCLAPPGSPSVCQPQFADGQACGRDFDCASLACTAGQCKSTARSQKVYAPPAPNSKNPAFVPYETPRTDAPAVPQHNVNNESTPSKAAIELCRQLRNASMEEYRRSGYIAPNALLQYCNDHDVGR